MAEVNEKKKTAEQKEEKEPHHAQKKVKWLVFQVSAEILVEVSEE